MPHVPPGCELVPGGPTEHPETHLRILHVKIVQDGTYAFYYPHTQGFGDFALATQIANELNMKGSDTN